MRGNRQTKHVTGTLARLVLEDAINDAARRGKLASLLESLLTAGDRETLAQRVFVGRLLRAGWSYRKIRAWTGASPNTVAAVDRWLKRENPHYRRPIPLLQRKEKTPKRSGFPDAARPLPGSIKDLYRSLTGTSLW